MYSREEILARKGQWRDYRKQPAPDQPFSLGIVATFTAEPLEPLLGASLLARGFSPEIYLAPYGQVMQTALNPQGAFGSDALKAACVLWRIEDIAARELRECIAGSRDALSRLEAMLADLGDGIRILQQKLNAPVIVAVPPYPDLPECSPLNLLNPQMLGPLYRRLCSLFVESLAGVQGIHLLDLDALQRWFGQGASRDSRKQYLYRQPYSENFLLSIGEQAALILDALHKPQKKCIAVDCDNTLWGGIVGEDGLDGLALGDEFPGSAFVELQRLLLHWKNQGALIAVLSKNNEPEVWSVFDGHDAMVLKRKDIAAWRIDWKAKSENLKAVAAELNIGIDSFVFLDDNPVEIEAMRAVLPQVQSVVLPEEPAHMIDYLKSLRLFERLTLSAEDLARTEMISQERERTALKASISHEDFLKSLGLKVEVFNPAREHIGRIAQLVNKTNQFNLTTVRRTEEEVRALIDSDDYRLYAARIGDRFGDYGLTGLVILHRIDANDWEIDTFLMSCRVLGRGVETALMSAALTEVGKLGARRVYGRYTPTDRNAPVARLLPNHGFTRDGEDRDVLELENAPQMPPHIEISVL